MLISRPHAGSSSRAFAGCIALALAFSLAGCHSADPAVPGAGTRFDPPLRDDTAAAKAITTLLTQQTVDWNRGDLDAFAAGYKNSPDILFIGRKVSRGYDQMLASYRHGYATRDAMGTLTFSQLEVQPLDTHFATATGHYHLERTAQGGGNADGYFLLVLEDTASGWKIVRDDTTSLPPPAAR